MIARKREKKFLDIDNANVNLDISPYRESGTFVLKGFDEVQVLLDDHIVMTQAMSFSPFKGPFAQALLTPPYTPLHPLTSP